MSTVVFSGGVGGARFLSGLCAAIDPSEVTVISNTGDDSLFWGLYVCPDIDIVIYTLAGLINPATGWGLAGDSAAVLTELEHLGEETWFHLGDRDLAVHLLRSHMLSQGKTLSEVTDHLAKTRGLRCRILPMSNERVETAFRTDDGWLAFQEYMVKERFRPEIREISFRGAERSKPAPGVLEAIANADRIILAPSNPFISIGTILSVLGIRDALTARRDRTAAISPIVGGNAIKGPAAMLMRDFGYEVSAFGVAQIYQPFVSLLAIDNADAALAPQIEQLGMRTAVMNTIMDTPERKKTLAEQMLTLI